MHPEGTVFDAKKELQEPGMKLFHVQDIDVQSHHLLFKNTLLELKNWSDQHPVFVLILIPRRPELYTKAGIRVHFAGHMHLNDTGKLSPESNAALVQYSGAYPCRFSSCLQKHESKDRQHHGSKNTAFTKCRSI